MLNILPKNNIHCGLTYGNQFNRLNSGHNLITNSNTVRTIYNSGTDVSVRHLCLRAWYRAILLYYSVSRLLVPVSFVTKWKVDKNKKDRPKSIGEETSHCWVDIISDWTTGLKQISRSRFRYKRLAKIRVHTVTAQDHDGDVDRVYSSVPLQNKYKSSGNA